MKKLLCVVLALSSLFCLAACNDGKCDECESKKDVKVYELSTGDTAEYCPSCALSNALDIRGVVEED